VPRGNQTQLEKGIYKLQDGSLVARIRVFGKDYEKRFSAVKDARRWRSETVVLLKQAEHGMSYSAKSGWRIDLQYRGIPLAQRFTLFGDARQWLHEQKKAIDEGLHHNQKGDLLEPLALQWLNKSLDVEDSTWLRYDGLLRNHILPAFGNRVANEITKADVMEWIRDAKSREVSSSTVDKVVRQLGRIFKHLIEEGVLTSSPIQGLKLRTLAKKEMRVLSVSEVERLSQHCKSNGFFIIFLAMTGLRIGEARALQVRDVDLVGRRINVNKSFKRLKSGGEGIGGTKTKQTRSVPFGNSIQQGLKEQLRGKGADDFVFTNSLGGALDYRSFLRNVFRPAAKLSGIQDLVIHELRHTFASHMLQTIKAPVTVVSKLMGHSSVTQTLNTYSHLIGDEEQDYADLLDEAFSSKSGQGRGSSESDSSNSFTTSLERRKKGVNTRRPPSRPRGTRTHDPRIKSPLL